MHHMGSFHSISIESYQVMIKEVIIDVSNIFCSRFM